MMIKYLLFNLIYYNWRIFVGYISEIFCGWLCFNLWEFLVFFYMKNFCYCYNIKLKDDKVFIILRGVVYYLKEYIINFIGIY